jgi:hypothetical protein
MEPSIKKSLLNLFLLILLALTSGCAKIKKALNLCDEFKVRCDKSLIRFRSARTSSNSSPTFSSSSSTNPSSSVTRQGFGLEALHYKTTDFHFVSGTGIVGAAFSTSAPEDTFFGMVPMEKRDDFLERRSKTKEKYTSDIQVINVGYKLVGKKKKSKKKGFVLNSGLMMRYHKKYKTFNYGGGLSASWSALHAGLAFYDDQYFQQSDVIDYQAPGGGLDAIPVSNVSAKTRTTAVTTGIDLGMLLFDYTKIFRNYSDFNAISYGGVDISTYMKEKARATVEIYSFSAILGSFVLTYGMREEDGFRPTYNRDTSKFEPNNNYQEEQFFGLQLQLGRNFILSTFKNYYLQDELSFGLTLFI